MGVDTKPNTNDSKKSLKRSTFEIAVVGGENPDLIESLESVDLNSPDAKLNETSISDGLGGRIELNEDEEEVVKK